MPRRPIPVEREKITVGNVYYTCSYTGIEKVTVLKILKNKVLVDASKKSSKPFVRPLEYIFDNPEMARVARRSWEHDEKQRRKGKK